MLLAGIKTMNVTVKLFATLQKGRFEIRVFEVNDGSTPGDIMEGIGIPGSEVSLIFINNAHAGPDTVLKEGDTLALFPPVGGG